MQRWLVGQAVKTLASHAENMGSIPVRVTKKGKQDKCPAFSFFVASSVIEHSTNTHRVFRAMGSKHCSAASVSEALQGGANSRTKSRVARRPRDFSFLPPTCSGTSTRLAANRLTSCEKHGIIISPINKNLTER